MATDDEVSVKLSLKGHEAFRRDAHKAANSIDRIGLAARQAAAHSLLLRNALQGAAANTRLLNQSTRDAAAGAIRLRRELERASLAGRGLGSSTRATSGHLSGLSGQFRSATSAATSYGAALGAVGVGLTAAGGAAGVFGLQTYASMENASIAFNTMLGSAETGQAFITEMKDFAIHTPFQFDDVQAAAKQLMAFGFEADKVLPMLTDIGNASSALGLGGDGVKRFTYALGQMNAAGVLQGDEVRQLQELGLPAYKIIGDATGTTPQFVKKAISEGLVPSEPAIAALLNYSKTMYGGLMEQQEKTLGGLYNTFMEGIKLKSADVVTPVAEQLKRYLPGATDLAGRGLAGLGRGVLWTVDKFRQATPLIREFADAFKLGGMDGLMGSIDNKLGAGGELSRAWDGLSAAGGQIRTLFGNVFGWISDNAPLMFKIVGDVFWGIDALGSTIHRAWPGISLVLDGALYVVDLIVSGVSSIMQLLDMASRHNVLLMAVGKVAGVLGGGGSSMGGFSSTATPSNPLFSSAKPAGGLYPGQAAGGITRHPGMSWVGERGPELLSLPRGARVDPLPELQTGISAGGDTTIQLSVSGADLLSARRVADVIVEQLQDQMARR